MAQILSEKHNLELGYECPQYHSSNDRKDRPKLGYHLLFTLIASLFLAFGSAQAPLENDPGNASPGGYFDKVFDRLGVEYKLSDLDIAKKMAGSGVEEVCEAGYFMLHFETGSLLPGNQEQMNARRNTICQVFTDISEFINSPLEGSPNYVHIWIRPIEDYVPNPAASGVLGLASSFYIVPPNPTPNFGGIADNAIWQTIHNGIDAYMNVATPIISQGSNPGNYFHGVVSFNYQNPTINWNTILTGEAPNDQYDLYSVALHEAIHSLGFASLINWDGNSKFGPNFQYYSRYDTHLMNNSLSNNLIAPSDNSCESNMYNYAFVGNSDITHPGCTLTPTPVNSGSADNTICTQAIQYNGSVTVPVYTPSCFEPPSSLSHFEDQCYPNINPYGNNGYFVMSNANGMGPNFTKRHPSNEERLVLCDIGYNVNTSYGPVGSTYHWNQYTGACNGINIAGVNDGINPDNSFTWVLETNVASTLSGFLNNDVNANSISCPGVVIGMGIITNITDNSFDYQPTTPGMHLLRYIPINGDQIGNITYIYLFVSYGACVPNLCSMVNNGDFEQAANCAWFDETTLGCWQPLSGSPDMFKRLECGYPGYITNESTYNSDPAADSYNGEGNNNFIGLWATSNGGFFSTERVQTQLSQPLLNGSVYQISFYARVNNTYSGWGSNQPAFLELAITPGPIVGLNEIFPVLSSIPSSMLLCPISEVPQYDNDNINEITQGGLGTDWHYFEYILSPFTGLVPYSNLIISYDIWSSGYALGEYYVFIDDIKITPLSNIQLNLPEFACSGNYPIEDLEQFASPQGGQFSGDGVEEVINGLESTYNFNPTGLPNGDHIVTYTTIDNLGCTQSTNDIVNVGENCIGATTISSNTTWSGVNAYYCDDVTVSAGIHLFIQEGSAIYFAEGKGIKLQDGADLTISNSTVTVADGCGNFWAGISADMIGGYAQTINKNLININNSTLSFAETAISLYTVGVGTSPSTPWVICNITNSSVLKNNRHDFYVIGHYLVGTSYLVQCSNSTFITDDNFPSGFSPQQSKSIFKNNQKRASFLNCKYVNTIGNWMQNQELTAINAENIGVEYKGTTIDENGITNSIIQGFTYGIKAVNSTYLLSSNIYKSAFYCWRGAYLRNAGFASIKDNEYYNLPQYVFDALNLTIAINGNVSPISTTGENGNYGQAPYGLYIDGNTKYYVQDNLFQTTIPGIGPLLSHGLIVNNTGDWANKVRRNNFTGMHRALKFQGDNTNAAKTLGSFYMCNSFSNNWTDIREIDSNTGLPLSWGLPHQNGATGAVSSQDPMNTFTSNTNHAFDDIKNMTTTHKYFRPALGTEPMTNEVTTGSVILQISQGFIDCVPNQGLTILEGGDGTCGGGKIETEIAYEQTKAWYDALVDGGNSEELADIVTGTTFSEALQTYYTLMQQSPALSEEVMIKALNQYNLPNVLLYQILASNPSAAKSDRIRDLMDTKPMPFDEYQKAQVMLGLTLSSSKEELEGVMSGLLADRSIALTCLLKDIEDNDAITDKRSAMLALLDETKYFNDLLLKIDLFAQYGDFSSAIDLANQPSAYLRLSGQDKVDLNELVKILTIEQSLFGNESALLSASDTQVLEAILYSTSSNASERALTLLTKYSGYKYEDHVLDDQDAEPKRLVTALANQNANIANIYPNPTNGLVIVDCSAAIKTVTVFNTLGQEVLVKPTAPSTQQHAVDLTNLAAGIYEIRLIGLDGTILSSSKLIKE